MLSCTTSSHHSPLTYIIQPQSKRKINSIHLMALKILFRRMYIASDYTSGRVPEAFPASSIWAQFVFCSILAQGIHEEL